MQNFSKNVFVQLVNLLLIFNVVFSSLAPSLVYAQNTGEYDGGGNAGDDGGGDSGDEGDSGSDEGNTGDGGDVDNGAADAETGNSGVEQEGNLGSSGDEGNTGSEGSGDGGNTGGGGGGEGGNAGDESGNADSGSSGDSGGGGNTGDSRTPTPTPVSGGTGNTGSYEPRSYISVTYSCGGWANGCSNRAMDCRVFNGQIESCGGCYCMDASVNTPPSPSSSAPEGNTGAEPTPTPTPPTPVPTINVEAEALTATGNTGTGGNIGIEPIVPVTSDETQRAAIAAALAATQATTIDLINRQVREAGSGNTGIDHTLASVPDNVGNLGSQVASAIFDPLADFRLPNIFSSNSDLTEAERQINELDARLAQEREELNRDFYNPNNPLSALRLLVPNGENNNDPSALFGQFTSQMGNAGVRVEGNVGEPSFSLACLDADCFLSKLGSTHLATLPLLGNVTTEGAVDFFASSALELNRKSAETSKVLGEAKDLYNQAGVSARMRASQPNPCDTDPSSTQCLTFSTFSQTSPNLALELQRDKELYPDDTLTPEEVAARNALEAKLDEAAQMAYDGAIETAAIVAMTYFGGPALNKVGGFIKGVGGKLVGSASDFLRPAGGIFDDLVTGGRRVFGTADDLPMPAHAVMHSVQSVDDYYVPPFARSVDPEEAREAGMRIFNSEALHDDDLLRVSHWIRNGQGLPDNGLSDDVVNFAKRVSDDLMSSFVPDNNGGFRLSPVSKITEAKRAVINALEHEGNTGLIVYSQRAISEDEYRELAERSLDATIRNRQNQEKLRGAVEEARKIATTMNDSLGGSASDIARRQTDIESAYDLSRFHSASLESRLAGSSGEAVGGFFIPRTGQISITEGTGLSPLPTIVHECRHTCDFLSSPQHFNDLTRRFGKPAAVALNEGRVASFEVDALKISKYNQSASDASAAHTQAFQQYKQIFEEGIVPELAKRENVTIDEARKITYRDPSALDKIDDKKINEILDQFGISRNSPPEKETNKLIKVGIATAGTITAVISLAAGADLYLSKTGTSQATTPTPVPTQRPDLLNLFNFTKKAFAQEESSNSISTQQPFDLAVKKELVKHIINTTGKVGFEDVAQVLEADTLEPRFNRISEGYKFTTGSAGVSWGLVDKDLYSVVLEGIPGIDIQTPLIVDAKNNSTVLIPISISKGSGKVESKPQGSETSLIKTAYAQENDNALANGKTKVQVLLFQDENRNGKFDTSDAVLPWANLIVKLKGLNNKKDIFLNQGWNLFTLTNLPSSPLTANELLQEIAKQNGYATTVSTLENGLWKSYVVRGDKTYSGEDFPIVPGRAYFVKALKQSVFTYQGQEFVAPVDLTLNEGWNAVGLPKTSQEYKISDVLSKLDSSGADAASRWESGLWDSFVTKNKEDYGENFPIETNRGYIIRVRKNTAFTP
ncbi:MAG: TATA-binding protein-associated factor 2N-like [Microgenomates group bacterium Gr01-1014_5]|nr:MAG: TATA-binding protein-associated factor 2N-like [Microgenomates group bacterium Gr01-1014_5]